MFLHLPENDSTKCERAILSSIKGIKRGKDFDINEDTYPIDDLSERNIFLEGVSSYLGIDVADIDAIVFETEARYSNKGIEFTKTIRQWLQGKKKPSQSQAYRHNCYNFCIALDMDINKTFEFMFKHFQIMPFYYKNRTDAIYFYCILNNKCYDTIVKMHNIANNFPATNDETVDTKYIGNKIYEIENDEEFLDYLKNYCYDDEHQFATARRIILELLDKCKELAVVNADSQLLMSITGYNNQIGRPGIGGRADKGISKSLFPPEFTTSFPDDNVLCKIRNGKKVSDEALRKLLILLTFYHFYKSYDNGIKSLHKTDEIIQDNFRDFCAECDGILAECGYVQLYPRNLYDWHILCCANSEYPVEELKSLIKQQYTDKLDEE
ncbi:MAG: hypothetical protein IKI94_07740 [Ruminococcus sp.]|nr:hypothetical protein [Ruminococcus sp.]